MYGYIKSYYGKSFKAGDRVVHTVTGGHGAVAREDASNGHYVQVRFDGRGFVVPCHPNELTAEIERLDRAEAARHE